MDVLTIGELLVEFVRKGKDSPHRVLGEYAGPFPSGAPAIFADTAARLGLETGIVGAIGEDDFGRLIIARLRNDRVNVTSVRTCKEYTTGTTFVTYYSNGERQFLFHLKQSAAAQIRSKDVVKDFVKSFAALHIMGSTLSLNEIVREACYKAVRIASKAGMIISFDPNLRAELMKPKLMRKISEPLLKAADIVLPSRQELFDLTGETAVDEASEKIFKHGVENLIMKHGAGGSMSLTKQGRLSEPAYDVVETDPTGAGDAFDAAVILGYLRKWTLEATLDYANAVGALKVTKVGPMAVPENALEVTEFMKKSKKRM